MTEFTRIWQKINEIDDRLKKFENTESKSIENPAKEDKTKNKLDSIGLKLQGQVDSIGQQKLILIALYYKPKQSKQDLLNVLLSWGIKNTIHKWFKGSNFKHRLLDIGLIMKDGVDSNDDDLYTLTIGKGILSANKLIEKYIL